MSRRLHAINRREMAVLHIRIMPSLKVQIDGAASESGLSVNQWAERVLADAVTRPLPALAALRKEARGQ
jgi:predicted HicB family RNase H-like nuclease